MAGPLHTDLLLIDGQALGYRLFYGNVRRGLLPEIAGERVDVLVTFLRTFLSLVKEIRPWFAAIAFDLDAPTFRHALAEDYKLNRAGREAPGLLPQLAVLHEALRLLGCGVLLHETYEADDLLATAAVRAARQGLRVAIVAWDKDLWQIASDRVLIYEPASAGGFPLRVLGPAQIRMRTGLEPGQIPDLLALAGDPVDGIRGVPGVGRKTATMLLQTHGTLEAVLRAAESMSGKIGRLLRAHAAAARAARALTGLRLDAPLGDDLERWRLDPDGARQLADALREQGLIALSKRVEAVLGA